MRFLPLAVPAVALVALAAAVRARQSPGDSITLVSHGATLQARVYRATSPGPHPTAVLFTGFPGNGRDILGLGPALSAAGWNALFFNPRGFHGSEGQYTPARGLEDAAVVLGYVRAQAARLGADTGRIAAVGYSHGGWAALMAGTRGAPVRCLVAVAPDNLGLGGRRIAANDSTYLRTIRGIPAGAARAGVAMAGDAQALIDTLRTHGDDYDPMRHAAALAGKPVLVIGGWRDQGPLLETYIVPLVRALRAADARVTPLTLDDDHGFVATRAELQRTIVTWLNESCRAAAPSP